MITIDRAIEILRVVHYLRPKDITNEDKFVKSFFCLHTHLCRLQNTNRIGLENTRKRFQESLKLYKVDGLWKYAKFENIPYIV